jgi:hypothetical protein
MMKSAGYNRVGQGHCCLIAPSELYRIVSHHPAQAFQRQILWKLPAVKQLSYQLCDNCNDSFNRFRLMDAPSRSYPDAICFSISKDYQCFPAKEHQPDVCHLSGPANLGPVSTPLQDGIRYFRHLTPAYPTVCLTVHLPALAWQKYGVTTFHVIDTMDDLGAPY